ncbi:MAG: Unknown protein [uncultured Thiotrichaceae bacterium]|uniref:Uncharacterized protein n=1 Tax=uncultured Thiotrichaceae bacterium TaxID=298394 RepID=A0A6S6T6M8_9GAMM|nr:MAG: Unknown protein [uncultured Thiotrichaceae bacterium]
MQALFLNSVLVAKHHARKNSSVAYFLNNLINRLEEPSLDITKDVAFPISRKDSLPRPPPL